MTNDNHTTTDQAMEAIYLLILKAIVSIAALRMEGQPADACDVPAIIRQTAADYAAEHTQADLRTLVSNLWTACSRHMERARVRQGYYYNPFRETREFLIDMYATDATLLVRSTGFLAALRHRGQQPFTASDRCHLLRQTAATINNKIKTL